MAIMKVIRSKFKSIVDMRPKNCAYEKMRNKKKCIASEGAIKMISFFLYVLVNIYDCF